MSQKPGLNLADLAPMHEDVPIGKSFLRVYGISARTGLEIFSRFPKVLGMVSGEKFNLPVLVSAAPDAVAAIIAASTGQLGEEEAEANAARLPLDIQVELIEAIGRLTFTKGFGPFVEKVTAFVNGVNSGISGKVLDTRSLPVSKV